MKDGKFQVEESAGHQPRTLFKPGSWFAKIDFINHLVLFNNVLITVLSEKEGGKTSFATLLQGNLDPQIKPIALTIKIPCDEQEIINQIATELHLSNDAQTSFSSVIAQINERKAHVLLIIDDAQNLPESMIKDAMVAIKNQEDFGFFHICLVSDYSVVAALNSLAGEQCNSLVHSIELGPLNESETRTYILQRAMSTGLINKPLSEVQYKQFYKITKGNMARINATLASFIFNSVPPKNTSLTPHLKRAGIAMSAAVVAGVSYFYFVNMYNKSAGFDMASTTNASVQKATALVEQPPQLASQIPSWLDSSTRQLVHFELPKKQILDDMGDEEQEITTVALVDKVVVIPTVKAVKEERPHEGPKFAEEKVLPSEIPPIRLSENAVKKTVKKTIAHNTKVSHYTIQLIASHNVSDVNRFRANNKLATNTKIRHFTNSRGTWYILTLGDYESFSTAQTKASELPADLTKLNPWIRPTSGLSNVG